MSIGLGRYLVAHGNARDEQILRDAVAGEVFGFGISEAGNDLVLFGSTTRDRDGRRPSHRGTGSCPRVDAPAHLRARRGEEGPKSVFGVVHHDGKDCSIRTTGTLGMRATQSMTTLLEASPCPERILTITDRDRR